MPNSKPASPEKRWKIRRRFNRSPKIMTSRRRVHAAHAEPEEGSDGDSMADRSCTPLAQVGDSHAGRGSRALQKSEGAFFLALTHRPPILKVL